MKTNPLQMELNAKPQELVDTSKCVKSEATTATVNSRDKLQQTKKTKKLKHQEKLARLVANTFGPDSLDLFKSTMNAAAAIESAVAAHATKSLVYNKKTSSADTISCLYPNTYSSMKTSKKLYSGNNNTPANLATSNSSSSHSKTTKKLNRKFNMLQKKITWLIESNNLEPFAISAQELNAMKVANKNVSETFISSTTSCHNSNSTKKTSGNIDCGVKVDAKNCENREADDDEVSEVSLQNGL